MKEMTLQDAQEFIMPFGKYKGYTLSQIVDKDAGINYLNWLEENVELKGNLKEAVELILDDLYDL